MLLLIALVFTFFASSQAALENVVDASYHQRMELKNGTGIALLPTNNYCNVSIYQDNSYVRSVLYSNASCAPTSVCIKGACVDYSRTQMTIKSVELYQFNTNMVVKPYIETFVHNKIDTLNEYYTQVTFQARTGLQETNIQIPLQNLEEDSRIHFYIRNETSTADVTIMNMSLDFETILKRGLRRVVEKVEFNSLRAKGVMELEFSFIH